MKNLLIILILTSFYSFGQTANDGLYFDGIDDSIVLPKTTNIDDAVTNNRTYETSFKVVDATSPTKQFIMEEGGGTRAVIMYVESGYLYLGAFNRADYTPTWEGTFYREPIVSDTWYHVALVFDNAIAADATTNPMTVTANNALKWYLDGTLMGEISGYQLGGHNPLVLGYKNGTLRLPSCGTWTATGNSEYCFNTNSSDNGGNEYYFNGYIWGFRVWNDVRSQTEIADNITNIITTIGTDDLVAILDGDTFTYLDDADTAAEATVTTVPTIIWSATATTTNWNTATNWVGGVVPDSSVKQGARIQESDFYPEISSHIVIGDLIIETDASLTVLSGGTMEVSYDLTNDGTVDVLNNGSLILREKISSTSVGTFNIQRLTPTYTGNDFYSYWSSPVVSTDSNIATVFPDAELIYAFQASEESSDWILHGTSNFANGVGYAVQNEGMGGQLRTFTGNINKGDISVDVFDTSNATGVDNDGTAWSTSGDNLVGNPYSSAIDWGLVATDVDNSDIDGTIYLWQQTSAELGENNVTDYVSYNGTGGSTAGIDGKIASGQGFFIKTTANTSIVFKTTHQIPGNNTQFFKSEKVKKSTFKPGRSWFSFSKDDKINTLLVGFLEGATNGHDRLYDAPFDPNQTFLGFYTLVKGVDKATIQGLPLLKRDKKVVKMGYVVDEVGEYSIGIQEESISSDYYIYLRDKEKKVTIDLRQRDYTFNIDSIGENNTRFKLIYTKKKRKATEKSTGKQVVDEFITEIDSEDFTVYIDGAKDLIVEYDFDEDNIKEISMYNLQGRRVKSFKGNQRKNISNLSNGIYIVSATLVNNISLTKKILIAN